MSADVRYVIAFLFGNSNGGQSVSQAAPKVKNAVDQVFAVSIGDGAIDDMKIIASDRSTQINIPDIELLGEFIRLVFKWDFESLTSYNLSLNVADLFENLYKGLCFNTWWM